MHRFDGSPVIGHSGTVCMLAKVAAGERSADLMDATTGNSGDHAVPAQQRSRYGTRGAQLVARVELPARRHVRVRSESVLTMAARATASRWGGSHGCAGAKIPH